MIKQKTKNKRKKKRSKPKNIQPKNPFTLEPPTKFLATQIITKPTLLRRDQFRRNYHEFKGPIELYSDLFVDEKNKNEIYDDTVAPKPGDFVKFKDCPEKMKLNGRIGQVKKLLHDSTYAVSMMDETIKREFLRSNFEVLKNCNSTSNRFEIGEVIWPRDKKLSLSVYNHWVNDKYLTGITMQLFDALDYYENVPEYRNTMPSNNKYKEYVQNNGKPFEKFKNLCRDFFINPSYYDLYLPHLWKNFVNDYTDRVKEIYGWKKPKMFRGLIMNQSNAKIFIVCYDAQSEGHKNEWFNWFGDSKERAPGKLCNGKRGLGFDFTTAPKIRGPLILINSELVLNKSLSVPIVENQPYCFDCVKNKIIFCGEEPFKTLNETKSTFYFNRNLLDDHRKRIQDDYDNILDFYKYPCRLIYLRLGHRQVRVRRNTTLEFTCQGSKCSACVEMYRLHSADEEYMKQSYKETKENGIAPKCCLAAQQAGTATHMKCPGSWTRGVPL